MKKILGFTIVTVLLIGMTGIGTWAYFSDSEQSTGNTFAAGTLDLKTDGSDGVSQTLLANDMAPGDTIGPETIILNNTGSVEGVTLDLAFSYVESDGGTNPTDMTADQTAAMLEVTKLNYDSSSILGSVSDSQPNGYKDIQDLKNADLSGQSGVGALGNKAFEIEVKLRDDTSGDFQDDGITITMTFTLNQ
jgi:predicted ribosomally synthesized peptide with SipW-like signal peptide